LKSAAAGGVLAAAGTPPAAADANVTRLDGTGHYLVEEVPDAVLGHLAEPLARG
jgi:hypothetical protein